MVASRRLPEPTWRKKTHVIFPNLGLILQRPDAYCLLHFRKAKILPMVENEHLSEKAKHDLHLVAAAKSGSQAAYADLMERYRDSIYFMMLKMVKNSDDADDLTIEAFGKAFARLDQYSPSFAFSTWLFKIASNNCIDFIRKKRIEVTSIDRGITTSDGERMHIDAKSQTLNPEETIIHGQRIIHMRLLVSKLKPKYRELVEKRYFEEKVILVK